MRCFSIKKLLTKRFGMMGLSLIPILSAYAGQTKNDNSFLTWCQREGMSEEAQKTKRALLDNVGATTCEAAWTELEQSTWLDLFNKDISDLEGVGFMINLEWLSLNKNRISDISPLAKLEKLKYLEFSNNLVPNVDALIELKNMEEIYHTARKALASTGDGI